MRGLKDKMLNFFEYYFGSGVFTIYFHVFHFLCSELEIFRRMKLFHAGSYENLAMLLKEQAVEPP